jgi:hypothetical protein
MTRTAYKLTFAALVASLTFAFSSTFASAQSTAPQIFLVGGGRTTLTVSNGFLTDLTTIGATPTGVAGSELDGNQIYFPITNGSINLANAAGEFNHNGGILLTTTKTQVRMTAFLLNTIGEDHYITGLVEINGKYQGRVKLFDITLPSDMTLPIDPKVGDFFMGGVTWNLDPDGAAALNYAFSTVVFKDNLYMGYSLSLVLVPLTADGQ